MSNIKYVKGDLSDPSTFVENFDPDNIQIVLAQQTNCLGVMGAGVALSLVKRYPEILPSYQKYCEQPNKEIKGTVYFTHTHKQGICVANLFGQVYTGNIRDTNYEYIYRALENYLFEFAYKPQYILAFPKNMSSGLAGGNWNIIYAMIENLAKALNLENTIYIVEYVNSNEVKNHAVNPS